MSQAAVGGPGYVKWKRETLQPKRRCKKSNTPNFSRRFLNLSLRAQHADSSTLPGEPAEFDTSFGVRRPSRIQRHSKAWRRFRSVV